VTATSLFGYSIESAIPLGRLAPEPGERGTLHVELASDSVLDRSGELLAWFDDERNGSGHALARTDDGPLVFCSVTGAFLVEGGARRVSADPAPCAPGDLEHRLVATAIPLLAAELGDLVLHASAVVADGGAILFCGPSGRGKSTLALTLAEAGHPLLTEDGTVLTLEPEPRAWPGPLGVRVGGGLVTPPARHEGPVPVRALVVLEPRGGAAGRAERLRPSDAVPALLPEVIATGDPHLPEVLRRAALAAGTMPVWRARMPDDLAAAPEAAAAIVRTVIGSSA
jgi:hypothetical protein